MVWHGSATCGFDRLKTGPTPTVVPHGLWSCTVCDPEWSCMVGYALVRYLVIDPIRGLRALRLRRHRAWMAGSVLSMTSAMSLTDHPARKRRRITCR